MVAVHSHAAGIAASDWVARFAPLAPAGEVLDVACGSGRHALLFAALGHTVLAIDRDGEALQRLADAGAPGITIRQLDLEQGAVPAAPFHWPFAADRFAAIVVTNYLHRPLLDSLVASLAPGGMLVYETFARGNDRFGKPSNPDFLLLPGELLALAARSMPPLQVMAFEDGEVVLPAPAMTQRICAVRAG
jgi:SAM-dependent methyltransferase